MKKTTHDIIFAIATAIFIFSVLRMQVEILVYFMSGVFKWWSVVLTGASFLTIVASAIHLKDLTDD